MHELQKPPRGWKTASAPQAAPGLSHWTHRVITSHAPPARAGELRPWECDRPAPCRVCTCPLPRWNDLNKRGLRTRSRTRKFTAVVVLRLRRLPCNLVRLGAALMAAVRASSTGSPPLPMRSACSLEHSSRSTWVCHAAESTRFAAQPTD